nr:TOBE domain-containing protein [Myxosarcina sp. GI1]
MDRGYIAQTGTPHAIYQQPNTSFVADFIGVMNFLPGVVESSGKVRCGNLTIDVLQKGIGNRERVKVAIRPEDIVALDDNSNETNLPNLLTATIEDTEFLGSSYLVTLAPEGDAKTTLTVSLPIQEARRLDLNTNAKIEIQLPPESIQIFPLEAN